MTTKKINVALVVPHIFIHRDILPGVIFSPGQLALDLCEHLPKQAVNVTLFSPGPANTKVPNSTADLSYFQKELDLRGDTYIDLLKKHPFTFISLARQVQSELIAKAFRMANEGHFDVVHIYTNEEDTALPFAELCNKPVVFTHHDPFNFLVKYKNVFPKYSHLPWLSLSNAQRASMPLATNWVGTIYHGLNQRQFAPVENPTRNYIAFLGRIIEPKGLHVAIEAVKQYNQTSNKPIRLKIAGKHYSGHSKDTYWQTRIKPHIGGLIEYVGHITDTEEKRQFLAHAKGLIVPSIFDEPFGMVTIEALACDTPVIGLDIGATKEIVTSGKTGFIIAKQENDKQTGKYLAEAIHRLQEIPKSSCRASFLERFTLERMASEHARVYRKLLDDPIKQPTAP